MNLNSDKKYNQNEKEINRKGREKKNLELRLVTLTWIRTKGCLPPQIWRPF